MARYLLTLAVSLMGLILINPVAAQEWVLVDQLDVGDGSSEKEHTYRIVDEDWRGSRTLSYPDGRKVFDDGRGFQGSESWVLKGLTPNRPVKIVKRVDHTVANQVVNLYVDGKLVGRWEVPGSSRGWTDSEFVIPGRFITSSQAKIEQRYVSSAMDVGGFYYWAYQEPATRRGGIFDILLGGEREPAQAPAPEERPGRGVDREEQSLLEAMQNFVDSLKRYFETH